MNKYKSVADFFNTETPKNMEYFTDMSLAVSEQIMQYMKEKGWSQKQLAIELGKTESEISKWLSGMHNFTLKSVAKIAAVFDKEIITTPLLEEGRMAEETIHSLLQGFLVETERSEGSVQTPYEELVGIKKTKGEVEPQLKAA